MPKENFDLFKTMKRFRDLGWNLTVSEHDEQFHVSAVCVKQTPGLTVALSSKDLFSVWILIHLVQMTVEQSSQTEAPV